MKICAKCGETKPLEAFGPQKLGKDGKRARCKACEVLYARARYKADPAKAAAIRRKWSQKNRGKDAAYTRTWSKANPEKLQAIKRALTLRAYGLAPQDYASMLLSQRGACAICGTHEPGGSKGKRFAVDHCHATGKVRGLLCSPCNTGLGQLKDDPAVLRKAIAYLEANDERPEA